MTAYLDVLLRGLALMGQAVAVGGVLYVLLVLRAGRNDGGAPPVGRALGLIVAGAVTLALAQAGSLLLHLAALADDRGWPLRDAVGTAYFRAGLIRILGCAAIVVATRGFARAPGAAASRAALLGAALAVAVTAAWLSHAAARMEERAFLLVLDTAHQLAASAWIGGLAHLIAASVGRGAPPWPPRLLARFSAFAMVSVGTLIVAGLGLSFGYIDGPGGLFGTSYGIMVLVKVAMLAGLLGLGAANFLAVRRLGAGTAPPALRVERFVEVELGLGLTVLFAAASLTSLPPAVDVTTDRAAFAEVLTRFTPRLPTLTSPPIEALPIDDREAPRTDEDRAWSEYNHHIAGLFVITMGLLAMVQGLAGVRWARHWPLLFLGLAAFMLMRNDPGAWPLGPQGFWEGFYDIEVMQHRVFVLLVVGFGLFEWMVRTARFRSPAAALVFPLLCIMGGAMLLTHSHAMLNVKQEFLTEVTHAPLGVLALAAGWGRWLELRLPSPAGRLPGWLWAGSFTLIGLLLVFYRES